MLKMANSKSVCLPEGGTAGFAEQKDGQARIRGQKDYPVAFDFSQADSTGAVPILDHILREFIQVELERLIQAIAVNKLEHFTGDALASRSSHPNNIPGEVEVSSHVRAPPEHRGPQFAELHWQLLKLKDALGTGLPAMSTFRELLGLEVELSFSQRSAYVITNKRPASQPVSDPVLN
jgi:hypothetical protein